MPLKQASNCSLPSLISFPLLKKESHDPHQTWTLAQCLSSKRKTSWSSKETILNDCPGRCPSLRVRAPEVKWSESLQSCSTLCYCMIYTVHGILQARILEWGAFPLFRASFQPRDRTQVSRIPSGFFTSWATGKPADWQVITWLQIPALTFCPALIWPSSKRR